MCLPNDCFQIIMPTYHYKAKKGAEAVEGRIEADSEKAAVEKLSLSGYLPVRVELEISDTKDSAKPVRTSIKSKGRVQSKEITLFSRQLASLLKSGVPILKALDIILEQSENPYLKYVLGNIHKEIKEGATFSSAFKNYPKIFPAIYIAIIHSGEDSGSLPDALLRIAEYRAKQEEIISRVRMALAYPVLMALVGSGTIIFMLTFVMPRLLRLFSNMGQSLPLPTRVLMALSSGLLQWWWLIILSLIGLVFFVRSQLKTEAGKMAWSALELKLPLFGKFILKAELSRFSRTLELLIKNGITILRAIDVAIPVLNNEIIKKQLKESYKDLEQGGSFGGSLKKSRIFPAFMSNLIIVGEESGGLSGALSEVAASYERDTDERIKTMANLLEPLMILGMGLVVGFIVVAMLLPIFEINVMSG